MPTLVDIRTPRAHREPLSLVSGYAGRVLEVSDAARAASFYRVLGLVDGGRDGEGLALHAGGATLVLVERPAPRTFPSSGTHLALRVPDPDAAAARAGAEVLRYREDRAAEAEENRYLADPDGNRVQLVRGPLGIDHVALETHDIEWSEVFYTHVLGGTVESRVGWHMEDYAKAYAWGDGTDDRAPGTRRWDKRYTTIEGQAKMPRPNPSTFVALAPGVVLGIYLANEHRQEPAPDVLRGAPRVVFATAALDEAAIRLREIRLRAARPYDFPAGPFEREGRRLFTRDVAGNFLELREV